MNMKKIIIKTAAFATLIAGLVPAAMIISMSLNPL